MRNKWFRILIVIILLIGLVSVRFFENKLFYDPLLLYFRDSNHGDLLQLNFTSLYVSIFFRFMLNLLISVLIIKTIFNNKYFVKFTIVAGILLFIILLPLYSYMLKNNFIWGELVFFYVRRFLIQPMLLIILVPCFYYQFITTKRAT